MHGPMPPPGWYDCQGQRRWWDGATWGIWEAEHQAQTRPPQPPPASSTTLEDLGTRCPRRAVVMVLAAIALLGCGVALGLAISDSQSKSTTGEGVQAASFSTVTVPRLRTSPYRRRRQRGHRAPTAMS